MSLEVRHYPYAESYEVREGGSGLLVAHFYTGEAEENARQFVAMKTGEVEIGKRLTTELAETRRQRDLLLRTARAVQEADKYNEYDWHIALIALYDAIRECEPPKPTREELLERIAEQAREMVNGGNVPLWDQFTQLEESVTELDALDGGGQ